jgi:hypothetical protein
LARGGGLLRLAAATLQEFEGHGVLRDTAD